LTGFLGKSENDIDLDMPPPPDFSVNRQNEDLPFPSELDIQKEFPKKEKKSFMFASKKKSQN